jgi:hypothetical protein
MRLAPVALFIGGQRPVTFHLLALVLEQIRLRRTLQLLETCLLQQLTEQLDLLGECPLRPLRLVLLVSLEILVLEPGRFLQRASNRP